MATTDHIDISGVEKLTEKLERYGNRSGAIVQEYLRDEGFDRIAGHIPNLIHASGRNKAKWKNKATASKSAYTSVFQGMVSGMTLTVSTKTRFNYLYFPDDGSNTLHHVGNQQFMLRGAQEQTDGIVDELVGRLVAAFEED
ncbi:MAG: hypothetical protein LUE24_13955 [Lachnospiraceae bacterium]|nr:hypothetical protein [Lachnospiraceae bacterium]